MGINLMKCLFNHHYVRCQTKFCEMFKEAKFIYPFQKYVLDIVENIRSIKVHFPTLIVSNRMYKII